MYQIRLEVDASELQATLRGIEASDAAERALDRCAFLVQENVTQEQIIRGGPRGAPPHPTRVTSRTGTLRRSIRVNRTAQLVRDIGTDLVYGRVHEFGGTFQIGAYTRRNPRGGDPIPVKAHSRRYPERPFLRPGLAAISDDFQAIFAEEIQRAIDGGGG